VERIWCVQRMLVGKSAQMMGVVWILALGIIVPD